MAATRPSEGEGCSEEVARAYREGITHAVQRLAADAPHASLYLDAGHGGWLGFEAKAARFAEIVSEMAEVATPAAAARAAM